VPLIARPWPRKYDRQWLRARRAASRGAVTIVKEPAEAAGAAIRQLKHRPARRLQRAINDATDAIKHIERLDANFNANWHAHMGGQRQNQSFAGN